MENDAKSTQCAHCGPKMDRRQALAKLGLGAAIAYAVPVVSTLSRRAHASGGDGGGEGGDAGDGSGGGGSGGDASAAGGSGTDDGNTGAETDDGVSATGSSSQ